MTGGEKDDTRTTGHNTFLSFPKFKNRILCSLGVSIIYAIILVIVLLLFFDRDCGLRALICLCVVCDVDNEAHIL